MTISDTFDVRAGSSKAQRLSPVNKGRNRRLLSALAALRAGQMVLLVDAVDRENEGDVVMAAEFATSGGLNFMAKHARGLICVPMGAKRLDELEIPPMTTRNRDPLGTAFHVGVDDASAASTGISASDRAAVIRRLADPRSVPGDFTQPGHVFPLSSRAGGVLERAGHTEASVELMRLAGLSPTAVICEVAADDGEMARMPDLQCFAYEHDMPLVMIEDLIEYLRKRPVVARVQSARMPLPMGQFEIVGYRGSDDGREHVALTLGDLSAPGVPLVRLHSECLTGDVFGSRRCDCGAQLELALARIAEVGRGVVVYLRGQEGRGIGLLEKLRAYDLQDAGLDTVDANTALGHPVDRRDYDVGAGILLDLGVTRLRLMSNNPAKRAGLLACGLDVVEQVPLVTDPTPDNAHYLETKRTRLGHILPDGWSAAEACAGALS
jgi:3,4-dihydroxy 2-butanone 4-phosphate synthase/GTP cyclohydrolase II